jgi:hypothetical protein
MNSWRTAPLPRNWPNIRGKVLKRDPYCQWGLLPDDGAPYLSCAERSIQVDHMGGPDDHRPEMLRGICVVHHQERTARQGVVARARLREIRGTRRRPKTKHPAYKKGQLCSMAIVATMVAVTTVSRKR